MDAISCDSGFRGFSVIAPTYAKNDEACKSTDRIYVYLYRKSWCRHQAALSHEHHDQCSNKRNSNGFFWSLRNWNQQTTTFPRNDHCKQTTVTQSQRATLGFSLGQHARGSIWVVQYRGCSTQGSLTSISCRHQMLDQHESQGKICNCSKRCILYLHFRTTTGFPAFLSHLQISAICSCMKSRVLDTNLAMLHDWGWSFMIQTPSLAKVEVLCASRCNTRAAAATRSAPAEPWRKVSMKCS